MTILTNTKKSILLATLLTGAIACSSKPKVNEFADNASADEEITNLTAAIENAKVKQTDVLAPENFQEAKEALSEAKRYKADDKKEEKVLHEVALGRAYLDKAEKTAESTKKKIDNVLVAREAAMKADAFKTNRGEFLKLDEELKVETAKIENDDSSDLNSIKDKLYSRYYNLELKAIKATHLGEAQKIIDKSVQEGAKDMAPQTLATAQKSFDETDAYITQNRHEDGEIQMRAAATLEAARKLQTTTVAARGLKGETVEQTALRMQAEEERLNSTSSKLNASQNANMALAASNTELSKDKQLDANYEAARAKFSPDEAEVYKQGKNLVIRLRGLEFPTSQAVLKGSNFPLLKKVQEVITSFDKSSVMVEGHTDSQGGKKINDKLSNERAEAVKQYLEANSSDKVSDFEAKGYGFEKPLASNKTAAGRAQNRRVDVIIEPEQI